MENSLDRFNSRSEIQKKRIRKLEEISVEKI